MNPVHGQLIYISPGRKGRLRWAAGFSMIGVAFSLPFLLDAFVVGLVILLAFTAAGALTWFLFPYRFEFRDQLERALRSAAWAREPLYVSPTGFSWAMGVLTFAGLGLALVPLVLLFLEAPVIAVLVLSYLLIACYFVYLLVPRRYEVWPQHLAIVVALGIWRIPFADVELVRPAEGTEAHQRLGLRFITISNQAITIVLRRSRWKMQKIVISPPDSGRFLQELGKAMAEEAARVRARPTCPPAAKPARPSS